MAKKGKERVGSRNIKKSPHIYIGTSGWSYKHWKENFYPKDLKPKDWLGFYSQKFPTVEVNSTFYHTPLVSTLKNWHSHVPDDFLFSIKANRYITHMKRLQDCDASLDIFFDNVKHLKSKMGPILFQLPPSFKADKERLIEFIDLLKNRYEYVFEFRHKSWYVDEIYELLSKNNIGLCITDLNGKLSPEVITSHFTYVRLHGPKRAYKGTYGIQKLRSWKKKIEEWNSKYSVFCYFDNDEKGYAIQDAIILQNLLSK